MGYLMFKDIGSLYFMIWHFLDSGAEICQIFRWFLGKFKSIIKTVWNYLTFNISNLSKKCIKKIFHNYVLKKAQSSNFFQFFVGL